MHVVLSHWVCSGYLYRNRKETHIINSELLIWALAPLHLMTLNMHIFLAGQLCPLSICAAQGFVFVSLK